MGQQHFSWCLETWTYRLPLVQDTYLEDMVGRCNDHLEIWSDRPLCSPERARMWWILSLACFLCNRSHQRQILVRSSLGIHPLFINHSVAWSKVAMTCLLQRWQTCLPWWRICLPWWHPASSRATPCIQASFANSQAMYTWVDSHWFCCYLCLKYVRYTVKAIGIVWGKLFWGAAQWVLYNTCDRPDIVDPRQKMPAHLLCCSRGQGR
jgi:hypothetical protein